MHPDKTGCIVVSQECIMHGSYILSPLSCESYFQPILDDNIKNLEYNPDYFIPLNV